MAVSRRHSPSGEDAMTEAEYTGPYTRGAPDPTLLTRSESLRLEERMQREFDEKIRSLKELHEKTFMLLGIQINQAGQTSKEAVSAALLSSSAFNNW